MMETKVKVIARVERQEKEVTEEPESHIAGNGKGIFFIWGGTVNF